MCTSFSIKPFEGRGGFPRSARGARRLSDTTLEEEHRDERVDREGLGEAEADDHGYLELGKDLRLAPLPRKPIPIPDPMAARPMPMGSPSPSAAGNSMDSPPWVSIAIHLPHALTRVIPRVRAPRAAASCRGTRLRGGRRSAPARCS